MERLTVVVGMNNPHSDRPELALAPHPRGVAGHNLWRMANAVCGVSRAQYMRTLERINLCVGRTYDPKSARKRVEELETLLVGRRVILLGDAVRKSFWLGKPPLLSWQSDGGMVWCQVPHPSGLNRMYNHELVRMTVGMRMEAEIVRGCSILGEDLRPTHLTDGQLIDD